MDLILITVDFGYGFSKERCFNIPKIIITKFIEEDDLVPCTILNSISMHLFKIMKMGLTHLNLVKDRWKST